MSHLTRRIPVHAPGLRGRDYVPYLASAFRYSADDKLRLESVWSEFLGPGVRVPTPTGRHALWYFLEMQQLRPGDEVLVAAYNFYVVVQLLVQKGLVPVFVDIEPDTLCMSADDLLAKVSDRSRLVLVTHMFGIPADLTRIRDICDRHDLLLFEDCAHAVGTRHQGAQVGQAGDGALFSFGIQKLLTTFGGGMLNLPKHTEPPPLPEHRVNPLESTGDTAARVLSAFVMEPRLGGFIVPLVMTGARFLSFCGSGGLLNTLAPARNNPAYRFSANRRAPFKPFMKRMMVLQLQRIRGEIERRRSIVHSVKAALSGVEEVGLLSEDKHGYYNGAYFGIFVPDAEGLSAYLERRRVGSSSHEFLDCSRLEQFAEFRRECPNAQAADRHLLRLPSYASIREFEKERIVEAIRDYFRQSRTHTRPQLQGAES
ncbi:MAG: aminotransferase class I/II-fold pyridoxal phosphate-dependent enzyme [Pyrinomonadaceae bacterium]